MEYKLFNSIISIRDNNDTQFNNYNLVYEAHKYSNTKVPIYKISIDNKTISRNNKYYIKYCCPDCNSVSEITLNLFVRKINKNIKKCSLCREYDADNRISHSNFMKNNGKEIFAGTYTIKKPETIDRLEKSKIKWNETDDFFKDKYSKYYLNQIEFDNIKNKIISIQNDKIKSLDGWEYLEHIYINNQTRFNPFLYNKSENRYEKPLYIKLVCENCDEEFVMKDLHNLKNITKIMCKTCKFTNNIFKIRYTKNINNDKVRYQSKQELRFIEWCNENKIVVINGPVIEYLINDKHRKYYVDFELPEFNIILEMKDNHCWHKKQVNNGIFDQKNKYAEEYASKNNKNFIVIFNKDINSFKNSILNNYKI